MKNLKNIFKYLLSLTLIGGGLSINTTFAQSDDEFNDAEIAAIAVAANDIDIKYAEIAKDRGRRRSIRKFARTMISDHSAVIEQAVALVTELKVTPQENDLSKKLKTDAQKTREKLKNVRRHSFDKAYIDNEVAYHKAVINAVENVLIPDTENAQLKDLLKAVLPALKAHLEHAEEIKKDLS